MKKFGIIFRGQSIILNRSFLNYLDRGNTNYDTYIIGNQ
jgi:hypothetical protein